MTIYHTTDPDGTDGYYSSRLAAYLDNAGNGFPVGIDTLNRHDWSEPFSRDGWVMRKAVVHTTQEVRDQVIAMKGVTPEDFD